MELQMTRRSALRGGIATALVGSSSFAASDAGVSVVISPHARPRVRFGAERLREVLTRKGYRPAVHTPDIRPLEKVILVGNPATDEHVQRAIPQQYRTPGKESFRILAGKKETVIAAGDDSGAMYGCRELAEQVEQGGTLPGEMDFADSPKLRFRGTCLLWMKWGGLGYDWPVTRANFPWFFDRNLMLGYLDFLAENRFNTIYFWSGHPFPYFLRLPKFPEARMLGETELQTNIDYFGWLTEEADRRGIWTVLQFYNIHVSAAFAEYHKAEGVKVTNPTSTALLADYTRHCVSEFVNNFPNVGLLVCAGEALSTGKEEWIRDVIIAGVKDTGKQPPIIVREWTMDRERFREIVSPSYANLYTMMKHNVEMLVSPVPDARNKAWVGLGGHHLVNVHENADVKPLRWASPSFIRQTAEEWARAGISGCHVYPMVSWLWPYCLDRTEPPLLTTDRDGLWLQAFGRYSWNFDRKEEGERNYWVRQLEKKSGSREAARHLLDYYEFSGPVMPGIQNLLSIHNMNAHPTIVGRDANVEAILNSIRFNSLGSDLAQPLDRATVRHYVRQFGGEEEKLAAHPPMSVREFVERLVYGESAPHEPIMTPRNLAQLFQSLAARAVESAKSAALAASRQQDEVKRFVTDAEILREAAAFYGNKIEAAIHKGLFDRLGREDDAREMLAFLRKSVEHYGALTRRASEAYSRPSDLDGVIAWERMLAAFQDELAFYEEQTRLAKVGADILCLGVQGPFQDFSNAFHWELAGAASRLNLGVASYFITTSSFNKAKLAVVYNMGDPFVHSHLDRLMSWVDGGGRLLIWDEHARLAVPNRLLPGLEVVGPSEERVVPSADQSENLRFRFVNDDHVLVGPLRGRTLRKANRFLFPNNIKSYSKEWTLLAYSIVFNKDYEFLLEKVPDGPIWVKRMDSQFCPLLLERAAGTGKIAVMQLGRWNREQEAEREFAGTLASNVLRWAGF
jgi:hypothetical protein